MVLFTSTPLPRLNCILQLVHNDQAHLPLLSAEQPSQWTDKRVALTSQANSVKGSAQCVCFSGVLLWLVCTVSPLHTHSRYCYPLPRLPSPASTSEHLIPLSTTQTTASSLFLPPTSAVYTIHYTVPVQPDHYNSRGIQLYF